MSSRSRRMTKKQKIMLVKFIEVNSVAFNAVTSHNDLEVVNEKWQEISAALNNHGPVKTVKQWKEAFGELKTKVKKKARELLCDVQSTGGGPATKKPLTDLEERLLNTLCQTVVTGVSNVPEPGIDVAKIPNYPIILPSTTTEVNSILTEIQEDSTAGQIKPSETMTRHQRNRKLSQKHHSSLQNIIKKHSKLVGELYQGNLMVAQGLVELAHAVNNMASAISKMATLNEGSDAKS